MFCYLPVPQERQRSGLLSRALKGRCPLISRPMGSGGVLREVLRQGEVEHALAATDPQKHVPGASLNLPPHLRGALHRLPIHVYDEVAWVEAGEGGERLDR